MSKNMVSDMTKKSLVLGEKFNIDIFGGEKHQLLKELKKLVEGSGFNQVATVNPEFLLAAEKDRDFLEILKKTKINTIDGIGIVWADEVLKKEKSFGGKILGGIKVGVDILRGKYRKMISAGSELMVDVCKMSVLTKKKVFFLGGFGKSADLTGEEINDLVGEGLVYKSCPGRPEYSDKQVLVLIRDFRPDVLFVAYGMKKQEEWIDKFKKELNESGVKLAMGVGRSFDYYSGKLSMAPNWIRRMGLEWLYSLCKDPKRWKRDIALIKFIWEVLVDQN